MTNTNPTTKTTIQEVEPAVPFLNMLKSRNCSLKNNGDIEVSAEAIEYAGGVILATGLAMKRNGKEVTQFNVDDFNAKEGVVTITKKRFDNVTENSSPETQKQLKAFYEGLNSIKR